MGQLCGKREETPAVVSALPSLEQTTRLMQEKVNKFRAQTSESSVMKITHGEEIMMLSIEKVIAHGGQASLWLASTPKWGKVTIKRIDDGTLDNVYYKQPIHNAKRLHTLKGKPHIPEILGIIMPLSIHKPCESELGSLNDIVWFCSETERLKYIYETCIPENPVELFELEIGALIVTKYIEGYDMFDYFVWKSKQTEKKEWYSKWNAVEYSRQLAHMLCDLHAMGIIHGDVGATNIRISPDGTTLTLIDFDMSRTLEELETDTEYVYGRRVPEDENGIKESVVVKLMNPGELRLASEVFQFAICVVCFFAGEYLKSGSWGWPSGPFEMRDNCLKWLNDNPDKCPSEVKKVLVMMLDLSPIARPPISVLRDVLDGGKIPAIWKMFV